jgi:hypothetical protein
VRITVLPLLALIAAAATPAAAQHPARPPFAGFEASLPTPATRPVTAHPPDPARLPDTARRRDTAALAFAGLLGGAAGLVAGGLIGARFQGSPCEDCYFAPFAGAVLGESLAIPLAIHLADGRRGQAAPGMVASLAIVAGGLVAAGQLDRAELLLAIPVLQIAAAVASERHTAGRVPN